MMASLQYPTNPMVFLVQDHFWYLENYEEHEEKVR